MLRREFLIQKVKLMLEQVYLNKKTLIILDVMMIIGILSNCGAYAMTNALAVKKEPTIPIYEVNPAAIITTDFAAPPKPSRMIMFISFILHMSKFILLGVTLGCYIWLRRRVDSGKKLLGLCLSVSIWFTILFLNFWNDFGFWIGKLLFHS